MKDNPKRSALIVPMAAALLLAALPNAAFSQIAGAGTVTGTLTDASGAVVPGGQIVVHNEDTGVDRQVSTNAAGIYVAAFLQPGPYEVSATKTGFVKVVRKGLTLQVGQTLTIDLGLSLQTTQETVAVTAAAPVVDVEKTEVSQGVSESLVDNLPLVGRRWDNFVLLTPAVTTDGNSVSFREFRASTTTTPSTEPTIIRHSFPRRAVAPQRPTSTAWIRSRNFKSVRPPIVRSSATPPVAS